MHACEKRFETLQKALDNKDKVAFWKEFIPPRSFSEIATTLRSSSWPPLGETYPFLKPYTDAEFSWESPPPPSQRGQRQLGNLEACKEVLELLRKVYKEKGEEAVLWLMFRGLAPPSKRYKRDMDLKAEIDTIRTKAKLPQRLANWYLWFQEKVLEWEQSRATQVQEESSETSGESASNAHVVEKQVPQQQQSDAPRQPQTPAPHVSQHIEEEPMLEQGGLQRPDALPESQPSVQQALQQAEGAEQERASHPPNEVAAVAEEEGNDEFQAKEPEDPIKSKRGRDDEEEEGGVAQSETDPKKAKEHIEEHQEQGPPAQEEPVMVSPEAGHRPTWCEPLTRETPFAATAIKSIPECGGIIISTNDGYVDLYPKEWVTDGDYVISKLLPIEGPKERIWYQVEEDIDDDEGNDWSEKWLKAEKIALPHNYVLVILKKQWRHDWWSGYSVLPANSTHLSATKPKAKTKRRKH